MSAVQRIDDVSSGWLELRDGNRHEYGNRNRDWYEYGNWSWDRLGDWYEYGNWSWDRLGDWYKYGNWNRDGHGDG